MELGAKNLGNEIVSLEVMDESHKQILADANAEDAMWSWMPVIATGTNFDSYYEHTMRMKARGDFIPFAITRNADGAFAGVGAFMEISRTHRRLRIGYLWHPKEMRGTEIHPATQLALLERAISARIRRVELHAAAENERAAYAAERIGAKREGLLRNYLRVADGRWADIYIYSLVDTELKAAANLLKDRIKELQDA